MGRGAVGPRTVRYAGSGTSGGRYDRRVLPPSPDEASARVRLVLGIELDDVQAAAVCGRLAEPNEESLVIRGRDVVTGLVVTRTTTAVQLLAAELP